jgi:hypothetical protein
VIAVTIGIGPDWKRVAERAAERMSACTGLQARVINSMEGVEVAHPSWLKCFIADVFTDHDEFLVFDADIIALRPWDPAGLFDSLGRPFCAVPEPNGARVFEECKAHTLPFPDWYVNGGLTIFGREHVPIWRRTWEMHPRYGSWLEQTALNQALAETYLPTCRLPRRFNALAHGGKIDPGYIAVAADSIVNLHCCSASPAVVDQVFAGLEPEPRSAEFIPPGRQMEVPSYD